MSKTALVVGAVLTTLAIGLAIYGLNKRKTSPAPSDHDVFEALLSYIEQHHPDAPSLDQQWVVMVRQGMPPPSGGGANTWHSIQYTGGEWTITVGHDTALAEPVYQIKAAWANNSWDGYYQNGVITEVHYGGATGY